MSKNVRIGTCRLCGRNTELTFEHVPPASVFNNKKVKMISGGEAIKQISNPNTEPWDLSKSYGKYQQRGRGGFYLCGECNSKTGQWYVPQYREFVQGIYGAMYSVKEREYASLGLTLKNIAPLPVIKQIMTMFCDINEGHFGDDKLIDYLLNKENNSFDYSRYHVYMHIHAGEVERMNGIFVRFDNRYGVITVSEISTFPVGFTLYIDKPNSFKPKGVELTSFFEYKYTDRCDVSLIIPKLECNIFFSGDYRTKEMIYSGKKNNQR